MADSIATVSLQSIGEVNPSLPLLKPPARFHDVASVVVAAEQRWTPST
jgi:hypothetical protein